jgi:hypothetical protein
MGSVALLVDVARLARSLATAAGAAHAAGANLADDPEPAENRS